LRQDFSNQDESNTVTAVSRTKPSRIGLKHHDFEGSHGARHGTRRRYNDGCRCEDCTAANTAYQQKYRQGPAAVVRLSTPVTPQPDGPGPVEAGVEAEIAELSEARPGIAQAALAMARLLDNPRAVSSQPAAAKVLAALLDKLRSAAGGRRGGLALVRTMTEKGGA
jgi:hypothetical protein